MRTLRQTPLYILCMTILVALAFLTVFSERTERSEMENRVLAQPVPVTAGGIVTGAVMKQTEDYLTDHFIARDLLILTQNSLDAAMLRTEKNGILLGERLMACTQNLQTETAMENAKAMGEIAGRIGADATVIIVPLSSAVTPERLPPFYQPADQEALIRGLYAESGLNGIDTLPVLLPLGEAAYYRTDHHWTADGAKAVYEALCGAWDIAPATGAARLTIGSFYGSYYAKVPRPFFRADTLSFDDPERVRLVIGGEAAAELLDPEQLQKRDKYAALLYGNRAQITLEGPGEGVLLAVKDSYANALLPLLAQHFERVEAFDPRYSLQGIPDVYASAGADRLLFLYGLSTLLTDRNLILQTVWEGE